jgi:hypothetical protein
MSLNLRRFSVSEHRSRSSERGKFIKGHNQHSEKNQYTEFLKVYIISDKGLILKRYKVL